MVASSIVSVQPHSIRRVVLVWGAFFCAIGCTVDANYKGVAFRCSADEPCQGGMVCIENRCAEPLGKVDAGDIEPDGEVLAIDGPTSTCLPFVAITDSFTGATLDAAKWTQTTDQRTAVEVKDGNLLLTPAATTNPPRFAAVQSVPLQWIEHRAVLEIAVMVNPASKAIAEMRVGVDAQNFYYLRQQEGSLIFGVAQNGAEVVIGSQSFSLPSHRFWQIRKQSGQVHADVSMDGRDWLVLGSAQAIDTAQSLRLEIRAGTTGNVAEPGFLAISSVNGDHLRCP